MRLNCARLFAFPATCENVDFMLTLRDSYGCRQTVFLKTAKGIVIIEHETDFHSPASEPEVNFAAMRKMIVNGDALLAVVLPLHGFRPSLFACHRFGRP